uniref:Uncharacterized protein n=1 Tax=Leersia perrieri TaxID=77586 RepID=A0A0D9VF68_9ORYZ
MDSSTMMGLQQAITYTLIEYIMMTPMMHFNETLVGEKHGHKGNYHYLTEEAKLLIRTILKELHFLHKDGKCPDKITVSNIFVKYGRAELKGVYLCEKEDTMIFRNYKEVYEIIMGTVLREHSKDDIPDDVMRLLLLMTSQATAIDMEYVICTHASLVPLGNREAFFMKMYKQIMFVLPEEKPTAQKKILQALPYDLYWYNKLEGNSEIEELFRNAIVHDMDDYHVGRRYTSDDFQLILWVSFPMLLPRMQEEHEKEKHLRPLNIHSLL